MCAVVTGVQTCALPSSGASGSINVTVGVKPDYDSDDMKVHREGDRLISIGKRLPPGEANAESIGMLAFVGEGPRIFREQVERMMRTPDGVQRWYLRAIDMIAKERTVNTVSIEGLRSEEHTSELQSLMRIS